jgi:hypothetical protein
MRQMFLKFRYRLGYKALCPEVADSISWQRFCRIPLGMRVPACHDADEDHQPVRGVAVVGLNEARYITIIVVDNAEPYACPRKVARCEVAVRADARRR